MHDNLVRSLAARQRQHSVNGDRLCQWKPLIFDPPTNSTLNRSPKICHKWLCQQPLPIPNLVQICPQGFWVNRWNITIIYWGVRIFIYLFIFYSFTYLFIPSFWELTYRSDQSVDFRAWWLKRHGLVQEVPLWVLLILLPI